MSDRTKPDILLIAYYFPPHQGIGGARPYRFYKYLKRAGFRCHVVTASMQATDSPPDVLFAPDSTASIWESRENDCLPIRAQIERGVRRLFFPGGLGLSWSLAAAQCCRAIIHRNPGRRFVLISSFPPVGALLAGIWVAFSDGIPWISDLRDPLHSPSDLKGFPFANAATRRLESLSFRMADAVIANTGPAGEMLRGRFPRAAPKIQVIWNGFDPEQRPYPRSTPPRSYKTLVHTGEMYDGRNADVVLESLARLRDANQEAHNTRVILLGEIGGHTGARAEIYARAEQEGWLERRSKTVPKSEAWRIMAESDFLLLLQPQSAVQVPGKLFEYACVGRPILAVAPPHSAIEEILDNAGIPHACIYPNDDPATIDRKFLEFLRLPSGPVPFSAWFESKFDAERQASQLASIIDAVSAGRV